MGNEIVYVSLIHQGKIWLKGDIDSIAASLRLLGLMNDDLYPEYYCIPFSENETPYAENDILIKKLNELNNVGVGFLEDYKQTFGGPAALMMMLKEKKRLEHSYRSISFDGFGNQIQTTVV